MSQSPARLKPSPQVKTKILNKALLRAVNYLGITVPELCAITGMSSTSVYRLHDQKKLIEPATKEWEFSAELIRIMRSLDVIFGGNQQQCQQWLRADNAAFNEAPIDAMKGMRGLYDVVTYLDAMRGKI